jgi:hypothetical protein
MNSVLTKYSNPEYFVGTNRLLNFLFIQKYLINIILCYSPVVSQLQHEHFIDKIFQT